MFYYQARRGKGQARLVLSGCPDKPTSHVPGMIIPREYSQAIFLVSIPRGIFLGSMFRKFSPGNIPGPEAVAILAQAMLAQAILAQAFLAQAATSGSLKWTHLAGKRC